MKSLSTSLLFLIAMGGCLAQSTGDYYEKIYRRPLGAKPYSTESLLKKFGDVRVLNRWYAGIEGFVITDKNTITNDFDGLIGTESPTVGAWGFVTGWVYHEQWSVEAEYARSAVHNMLLIKGDNPLSYMMENDKNSLILRGKMRLMWGKSKVRRSAFWLGAGAGLIPNSGREKDYMEFYGYREKGRRLGIDTLFVSSDTRVSSSATKLVEASAEYVIKMTKSLEMALYARKQWGYGNSLTTNLIYKVNNQEVQQATITGDGSAWKFGVSLRYVFHLGYDFSSLKMSSLQTY